ncbi:MAG: flavocytochrome c [Desulfobacterales bacterium]
MTQWDEQTEIIVIGSGLAGLCAAIEAAESGASVIVLEKMKGTGGNTRMSDGGVAAPNNYLQKERGIDDSAELFSQDLFRAGLGLNRPGLVRVLAEKANEAIEWTRLRLGVRYLDRLDRFGGHSAARCLTTKGRTGADFIRAQCRELKALGVEIRTRCLLTRLQIDERGDLAGVQVQAGYRFPDENSGRTRNIQALRAVILATGGFASDIRFRTLQNPLLDASVGSTNHPGATAEGLIAALAANAAPVHLSWIQLGPWGCADESKYGRGARFAAYSVYPAGILVDPDTGRRIVNEWSDRRQRCEAIFAAGHPCTGIVDATGANLDADSLHHCLKRGIVKGYGSLTGLAAAFGMPAGRLEKTVEAYNQTVSEGGGDPFGKPLAPETRPLSLPPFYAIRLWPKVHYTSGGVGIDERARVLDVHGRPIRKLYAAGEVCGGVHGASRLGNCALTECIVFGRIAGKEAAA